MEYKGRPSQSRTKSNHLRAVRIQNWAESLLYSALGTNDGGFIEMGFWGVVAAVIVAILIMSFC